MPVVLTMHEQGPACVDLPLPKQLGYPAQGSVRREEAEQTTSRHRRGRLQHASCLALKPVECFVVAAHGWQIGGNHEQGLGGEVKGRSHDLLHQLRRTFHEPEPVLINTEPDRAENRTCPA